MTYQDKLNFIKQNPRLLSWQKQMRALLLASGAVYLLALYGALWFFRDFGLVFNPNRADIELRFILGMIVSLIILAALIWSAYRYLIWALGLMASGALLALLDIMVRVERLFNGSGFELGFFGYWVGRWTTPIFLLTDIVFLYSVFLLFAIYNRLSIARKQSKA